MLIRKLKRFISGVHITALTSDRCMRFHINDTILFQYEQAEALITIRTKKYKLKFNSQVEPTRLIEFITRDIRIVDDYILIEDELMYYVYLKYVVYIVNKESMIVDRYECNRFIVKYDIVKIPHLMDVIFDYNIISETFLKIHDCFLVKT